jgi:hypothetical protein
MMMMMMMMMMRMRMMMMMMMILLLRSTCVRSIDRPSFVRQDTFMSGGGGLYVTHADAGARMSYVLRILMPMEASNHAFAPNRWHVVRTHTFWPIEVVY